MTRSALVARRLARRHVARGTFALSENRVLTTNRDGRMLFLDPSDTSLTPIILTHRSYEPGTSRLLGRIVRPGSRVVEVGANIGWHTLIAAERVGPHGLVKAFEPNPRLFDLLHVNVFVNNLWGHCFVEQSAVGRAVGKAVLRVPGTFSGGGNLRDPEPSALFWMHQDETEITVNVTTLDEALADNLHYDVLKLDVEGFEAEVFEGGRAFFAANPDLKIIMEFTPRQHGEAMLQWITSQGKHIHTIDRFGRTHRVTDFGGLMNHSSLDLFLAN